MKHLNCFKCFPALHLTQPLCKQEETISCSTIKYHCTSQHLQGSNKCLPLFWHAALFGVGHGPCQHSRALTGAAMPSTASPWRNFNCTSFLSLFSPDILLKSQGLTQLMPSTVALVDFSLSHRQWAEKAGKRGPRGKRLHFQAILHLSARIQDGSLQPPFRPSQIKNVLGPCDTSIWSRKLWHSKWENKNHHVWC